ncbi:MAG TPA: hypothetical protein VNG90_03070 [Candidatus Acidoferrum sp.]|nr:hypothetical protein [Candidatus Acidoferrum sp.]
MRSRYPFEQITRHILRDRGILEHPDQSPHAAIDRVIDHLTWASATYFGADTTEVTAFRKQLKRIMKSGEVTLGSPALANGGKHENALDIYFSAAAFPVKVQVSPYGRIENTGEIKLAFEFLVSRNAGFGLRLDGLPSPKAVLAVLGYFDRLASRFEESRQADGRPISMIAIMDAADKNIVSFIKAKDTPGKLSHFNLSVAISEAFRQAVLCFKHLQVGNRAVDAVKIFDHLVASIHLGGEPGIVFLDEFERLNPGSNSQPLYTTAPCIDIGLAFAEAATFGTINLVEFVTFAGRIDYDGLAEAISLLVTTLDNAVELSIQSLDELYRIEKHAFLKQMADTIRRRRSISVGACGFSEVCSLLRIRMGSEDSRELAGDLAAIISYQSKLASLRLGKLRGACDCREFAKTLNRHRFSTTKYVTYADWLALEQQVSMGAIPRNATTCTFPPNSITSLWLGVTPNFQPSKDDSVTNEEYLRLLSAVSRYSDGAVSGTLILDEDDSPLAVARLLRSSLQRGAFMEHLRAISIYRLGSR